MTKVKFGELQSTDIEIDFIGAAKAVWRFDCSEKAYTTNLKVPRKCNLLYFQISGKRNYFYEDKLKLTLNPGEGIFIPIGIKYYSELTECESSEGIYIDFGLRDKFGEVYVDDPFLVLNDERFPRRFECVAENRTDKLRRKAEIYRLLSEISRNSMSKMLTECERAVREKMLYINRHPELEVDVPKFARECCISETSFRKIFKECSGGLSPREYRNKVRIELADELLSSGRVKVSQVVDMLGFCDTSHYYKILRNAKEKTKT